jgi:hypothetical protein
MIKTSNPIDFKAIAKPLFVAHPTVDRYFCTSDGQAFELEAHASAHGNRLRNNTLVEIYRPELTDEEIKKMAAAEKAEQIAGIEASFERSFPELARNIRQNALTRKT